MNKSADENVITITRTITLHIDVLNHKEGVKFQARKQAKKLPVIGPLAGWLAGKLPEGLIPESVKKHVNDRIKKEFEKQLKPLSEKAPKLIEEKLADEGIKAKVSVSIY